MASQFPANPDPDYAYEILAKFWSGLDMASQKFSTGLRYGIEQCFRGPVGGDSLI